MSNGLVNSAVQNCTRELKKKSLRRLPVESSLSPPGDGTAAVTGGGVFSFRERTHEVCSDTLRNME